MNMLHFTSTALYLVLVNLIPLFGVIFFDWSVYSILIIYWLETGIMGYWNMQKMKKAEGKPDPSKKYVIISGKPITSYSRTYIIRLFASMYSAFMLVHGTFVIGAVGIWTDFDTDFRERLKTR